MKHDIGGQWGLHATHDELEPCCLWAPNLMGGAAEPIAQDTLAEKGKVMQGLWRCRARVSVGRMREETMCPWKLILCRLSGCVWMSRGKTVKVGRVEPVMASNPILATLRSFSFLLRTRMRVFPHWEAMTAIAFIPNVPDVCFTPRRFGVSSGSNEKEWEGVSLVLRQIRAVLCSS